jgi:hypothetical protein
MKKFLLITAIVLALAFVATNLLSIPFNINLKKDAHAVENNLNSFSVSLLFQKYWPLESFYDGPQDTPSPFIEPFKMLLIGVGLVFLSLIGRKKFKS